MGGEARQEEQAADTLADTQWLQGVWLDAVSYTHLTLPTKA